LGKGRNLGRIFYRKNDRENLKHLLLSLALIISANAWAEKNEMILLRDLIKDKGDNISNQDHLYVSYRCLSYYLNLDERLSSGGEKEKELSKRAEQMGADFVDFGWVFWSLIAAENEIETDYDDYTEHLQNSTLKMTRSYQIETSNSWLNTGSFINDYIHSEGITCQVVHEGYSSRITEK
jgi:hypothetical protein